MSISKDQTIYHYCPNYKNADGGINVYIQSLINSPILSDKHSLIRSLKNVDQSSFNLIHVHGKELIKEIRGECPVIYTSHDHNVYCPSGTKYLTLSQSCCDREMSYLGCTWGHLVNGCGSRRPQNVAKNLRRAKSELQILKELKIYVIAISDYVRNQLLRNGLNPNQVITLRNGISKPKLTSEPLTRSIHQNQRILFVGRIVPEKGLDWLLKSLKLTNQRIHLDIAGDGWDRTRLEKLADQLGVNEKITWHGWCSKEELDQLYQQCFAVIFPSVWPEPAGLVTLEAYAHYRPVIGSAVGGIPEHIRSGETGILVPVNDIKKMASAILTLSLNYQQCRSLGESGHLWFLEEFTMEAHIRQLQTVYKQCISSFQKN